MRRLLILWYWWFKRKHGINFSEMCSFLFKPKVHKVARQYIENITENGEYLEVTFANTQNKFFWPKRFGLNGIYQVTAETFDCEDWHYYQKKNNIVDSGEILLDVGAAEGLFALSVIDKCEKIILIEPNDFFVEALCKTFAGYRNKVHIHNVAVGSTNGEIVFDPNSLIGKIADHKDDGLTKKMITVDDVLKGEKISFLKADIEGFEYEMLKGAQETIRKWKPKMAITTYHAQNDYKAIIEFVRSIAPSYKHYTRGVSQTNGNPVMLHFWAE